MMSRTLQHGTGWMPLVGFLWLNGSGDRRLLAAAGTAVEADINCDTVAEIIKVWTSKHTQDLTVLAIQDVAGGILIELSTTEAHGPFEEIVVRVLDTVVNWAHLRTFGIISTRERARLIAERIALAEQRRVVELSAPSLKQDKRIRFEVRLSDGIDNGYYTEVLIDPFGRVPDEHRPLE